MTYISEVERRTLYNFSSPDRIRERGENVPLTVMQREIAGLLSKITLKCKREFPCIFEVKKETLDKVVTAIADSKIFSDFRDRDSSSHELLMALPGFYQSYPDLGLRLVKAGAPIELDDIQKFIQAGNDQFLIEVSEKFLSKSHGNELKMGEVLFNWACLTAKKEIVQKFLHFYKREAIGWINQKDLEGKTLLMKLFAKHSLSRDTREEMAHLLTFSEIDLSLADLDANNLLTFAIEGDLFGVVKKIVESFPINIRSERIVNLANVLGETPLIKACRLGNYEIASLLIDKGAHIGIRDTKGRTAMSFITRDCPTSLKNKIIQEVISSTERNIEQLPSPLDLQPLITLGVNPDCDLVLRSSLENSSCRKGKVHRLAVNARSKYFRAMNKIELEGNVSMQSLEALLHYFYNEEIDIYADKQEMLILAEKYQITKLIEVLKDGKQRKKRIKIE